MRRLGFLLLALVLLGPKTAFPAKTAGKLAVKAAMVTDYRSGRTLYVQAPDRRIAPASVTKVMTMYLVFDALASGRAHLSDRIKVSSRADATGGSSMNLRAGETVTLDELMRGMAVASGNDACIAIAEHFGGIRHFVAMMNRKAKKLGMRRTHFVNPNGLPAKGQLTTARDLTKLARSYLRHYPQALRYHSTRSIEHRGAFHRNTNRLLGVVDGVDGIKTGFVCSSGFNIIVTAKRHGKRIIAVILGGRTKQIRNREATRIVNAAYAGSIGSMMAAKDRSHKKSRIRSRRHAKSAKHRIRTRNHHRKKNVRMAQSRRRRHHTSTVGASRGASARFESSRRGSVSRHRAAPSRKKSRSRRQWKPVLDYTKW